MSSKALLLAVAGFAFISVPIAHGAEFDPSDPERPRDIVLQGSSYPKPFRDIDRARRIAPKSEDATSGAHEGTTIRMH
jgi:hypothetical protein